jgi:hypothetical protein
MADQSFGDFMQEKAAPPQSGGAMSFGDFLQARQQTPAAAPPPAAPAAPVPHPAEVDRVTSQNAQGAVSILDMAKRAIAPITSYFSNPGDHAGGRLKPSPNEKPTHDPGAPLVDLTQFTPQPGIARGVAEFASGLTSPENLVIMGATGGLGAIEKHVGTSLLSRLASLGFSAQMVNGALSQSPELARQVKAGDWAGVRQNLTKMALSAAAAAQGVKHATGPEASPIAPVKVAPQEQPGPSTPYGAANGQFANNDALHTLAQIETDPRKLALIQAAAQDRGVPVPARQQTSNAQQAAETLQHAKPLPAVEAAYRFDRAAKTQESQAAAKQQKSNVSIPVEGEPEAVTRRNDDRDQIAQQLAGKPFAQLSEQDRAAVDQLAAERDRAKGTREKAAPQTFTQFIQESKSVQKPEEKQPEEKRAAEPKADSERRIDGGAKPGPAQPLQVEPEQTTPTPAAAAPAKREPAVKPAYGRAVSVAVPGEQTTYPMRYAIREADDVQPSHNPQSFEHNPDYEHHNDRDYSQASNAARVVEHAQNFRPEFMLTDAPTAEQGAPLIDQRGNALGGNNRTMTLKRVYAQGGDAAGAYRAQLRERAAQFGIDPREVDRFSNPVLVREATYPVDKQQAQIAITDFNKSSAAAATPSEQAVRDGRRMTESTVNELGGRLQDIGEDATLAQALAGEDGVTALNHLVKDGVITQQEANGYVDDRGHLTPEAKDRIAKALVGRLFESPAEFSQTPPDLRNKLERIAPQVLRVEGREGWAITGPVREGLAAIGDARAHGIKNLDDLNKQGNLEGQRAYSPDALTLAKVMNNGPNAAAQAFRRYANDEALSRDGAQSSFFEPPTQSEAFKDAFAPKDPKAGERGAVSLQLLTLGAEEFWRDDVAPAIHDAAGVVADAADSILRTLAPVLRSESAQRAGLAMRNKLAELARRSDTAAEALKQAKRAFDRMTPQQNYDFIRRIEAGQKQQAPELQQIADVLRKMFDERRADVQNLGNGKLQTFYANYFPHIWAKPRSAAAAFARLLGRRPIEGGKGFLKQRTHLTFDDGLQAGLKPITDNAIEMALLKTREMDRYIVAHQTLAEWKTAGLAKFVRTSDRAPAGWTKITDPIGAVWGQSADGELVMRGNYYAPEGATRILNNYLEPGLRTNGAYRTLLGANNVLNQFQLGVSGFHAGFTSAETVVSKGAIAIEQALSGRPVAALKSIAGMPIAPVRTFLEGSKVLREWYKPGSEGADIAAIVDALEKAGGRARMDSAFETDIAGAMTRAFHRGNLLGGLIRAPFAATEALSNVIMKELVPRQKLGVFADLARQEMAKLGPGATVEQTRAAMAKAWDSVENRLGEMTYDNLFWDRTAKDLAMLTTRSVGWNLGTLREVGGAAVDAAAIAKRAVRRQPLEGINTHRLAYVASLAITGAVMGAIYQYLATGKGPEELKDYYFPRTGELDEGGRPQRASLPTYVKDLYHYGTSPGKTITGKASPLVSLMAEMIRNQDFYGAKIRNEDDPLIQQLEDSGKFVASQMVPMSVRNLQREVALNAPLAQRAQQFIGITPAPADLERSRADVLAQDITSQHLPEGGRTHEEVERGRLRAEFTRATRAKQPPPPEVADALRAGKLTARDVREARQNARMSPLARSVNRMSLGDALRVFRAATPAERTELRAMILRKAKTGLEQAPPDEREQLKGQVREALAK